MMYFDHLHLGKDFCKSNKIYANVFSLNWRTKWQSTLVLSEISHGQRSLVGYNPWGSQSQTWLSACTDALLSNHSLENGQILVKILVPLLTTFVTTDKTTFPSLSFITSEVGMISTSKNCGLNNFYKVPTTCLTHSRCSIIDKSLFPYFPIQNYFSVVFFDQFSLTG